MKLTTIIVLVMAFILVLTGCNSRNNSTEETTKEETILVDETNNTSSEATESTAETGIPTYTDEWVWAGKQLSTENPEVEGPSGVETYFNEDVSSIVENIKGTEYESTYWVRDDGIKMLGKYIICKAKLEETKEHPYSPIGIIIPTTVGLCIVCSNDTENDVEIAVTW